MRTLQKEESSSKLSEDLDKLFKWSPKWKVEFDADKYRVMKC